MADVVIIAKANAAAVASIQQVRETVGRINPRAKIILANSPIQLEDPSAVYQRRVLVIEDGPTTTHGGMAYGAGYVAATRAGVQEIVDPRPFAVPAIAEIYDRYPHIGAILPAMGYSPEQLGALAATIDRADVDLVISATPCDLRQMIGVNKPIVRAFYEFAEAESPGLTGVVREWLESLSE
jgi:predicted GTPase